MRWFNPDNWTFVFRGETFNLKQMVFDIQRLLPILDYIEKKLVKTNYKKDPYYP